MAQSVRYLDLEEHIEGILRCAGLPYRKDNLQSVEVGINEQGTFLRVTEFERDVLDTKIGTVTREIWVSTTK